MVADCCAWVTSCFKRRISTYFVTSNRRSCTCDPVSRPSSSAKSASLAFATPGSVSSEMIAADTRSRGVLPKDRTAMTRTLTGKTKVITFLDQDYFPLTFPLLFPHGRVSGWHTELKSTTGHKISLAQWVTQLLMTEPRFEKLGPLVNEFLIDVYSCIEDQRLSFHAYNQDKYRTSVHHASAMARVPRPRRDKAAPMDRIIVPSSFKGGFADMAKKLTESMALLRHFGKPSYFLTVTCNTVSVSALSLHYVFFILLSPLSCLDVKSCSTCLPTRRLGLSVVITDIVRKFPSPYLDAPSFTQVVS